MTSASKLKTFSIYRLKYLCCLWISSFWKGRPHRNLPQERNSAPLTDMTSLIAQCSWRARCKGFHFNIYRINTHCFTCTQASAVIWLWADVRPLKSYLIIKILTVSVWTQLQVLFTVNVILMVPLWRYCMSFVHSLLAKEVQVPIYIVKTPLDTLYCSKHVQHS